MATIKLRAGKWMIPVEVKAEGPYLYLTFNYNATLLAEIKCMQGAHWCGYDEPPRKSWRIDNTQRNEFQLKYLMGLNPYEPYDAGVDIGSVHSNRTLLKHQLEMVAFGNARHYCILAGEMGTGKTLAAIEIMESAFAAVDFHNERKMAWYIGPRAGVRAVNRELLKWDSRVWPEMMTYEALVRRMGKGLPDTEVPRVVIFDESSKIKTPTAQRSKAAMLLAEAVRKQHGQNGYVILMTGTPAPRTPLDWWHQCEVACPGFLKEGSIHTFNNTLALMEQRENPVTGGAYPHLITWRDSVDKCNTCGKLKEDPAHQIEDDFDAITAGGQSGKHEFIPGKNEVERLYRRMQGLVLVKFKKDCLDLPEKIYEVIQVKPTPDMLRTAQMIVRTTPKAIVALTLMRELSDGFQYVEVEDGMQVCSLCGGTKEISAPIPKQPDNTEQLPGVPASEVGNNEYTQGKIHCPNCGGAGEVKKYKEETQLIPTPKDEVLAEQLDEHEDIGRLVIWAGFTGTIDKIVQFCLKENWHVLRVDGRGQIVFAPQGKDAPNATVLFDAMDASFKGAERLRELFPKVVFIGNPKAGGMAYTLTASPTELFYSNDFSGEARMQSEDRFHRVGMDVNRGAVIRDICCLPTDMLVLDNLRKKRRLQDISMGEVVEAMKATVEKRIL